MKGLLFLILLPVYCSAQPDRTSVIKIISALDRELHIYASARAFVKTNLKKGDTLEIQIPTKGDQPLTMVSNKISTNEALKKYITGTGTAASPFKVSAAHFLNVKPANINDPFFTLNIETRERAVIDTTGLNIVWNYPARLHPRPGFVLREVWEGTNQNELEWQARPDSIMNIKAIEEPPIVRGRHSSRLSGYIFPKETGNYTFWIAADDVGIFYLSEDETRDRLQLVAYTLQYTGPREWEKDTTQKSQPIYLEAGKSYYFQALHVDGGGGSNLAVRWQTPAGKIEEPIKAPNFSK